MSIDKATAASVSPLRIRELTCIIFISNGDTNKFYPKKKTLLLIFSAKIMFSGCLMQSAYKLLAIFYNFKYSLVYKI